MNDLNTAAAEPGIRREQAADTFRPPAWLANRHLQSVLPSLPLRRRAVERLAAPMMLASRQLLLDCGEDVRLMGWLAEPAVAGPERLAVLLHGWEGSAGSLYILTLAARLYERGFKVLRLNLRDHGGTHGLNRGLFHSCRLAEVVGAIARLQALYPRTSLSLAGFSLGGNFMLRVAARAPHAGLRLARVVAVCPVLDPATTLASLESGPAIYRQYFIYKWRRSLRAKQAAWPGDYDFGDMLEGLSLTAMTEQMVLHHSGYQDLASYLRGYAIIGDALAGLQVPSRIIIASDDPMIPRHDLERLARPAMLEVTLTRYGGHCGFVEGLHGQSWIDREVAAELSRA